MDNPTKFESMVAEAFKRDSIDVTIEVKRWKVIWCRYMHNIENTKAWIEYILTSISPHSVFKENWDNVTELSLAWVLQNLQDDLHENFVIDAALQRLRLHLSDALKKPEEIEIPQAERFYHRHKNNK